MVDSIFSYYQQQYEQVKSIIQSENSKNPLQSLLKQLPKQTWIPFSFDQTKIQAKNAFSLCLLQEGILTFGGINDQKEKTSDFTIFSFQELEWQKVIYKGDLPPKMSGCQMVTINENNVFLVGGLLENNSIQKSCYLVNNEKKQISKIEIPKKINERTDYSINMKDKVILIFGGQKQQKNIFNDLISFSLETQEWKIQKTEGQVIRQRFGHSCVIKDNSLYVFGGWDGFSCLDDFYEYSMKTNIWYEIRRSSGKRPCPRYRHESIVIGNSMFLFGGIDHHKRRFNDFSEYQFTKRTWSLLTLQGSIPSARSYHKICALDNWILVIGGFDGNRLKDIYGACLNFEDVNDFNHFFDKKTTYSQISITDDIVFEIKRKIRI